MKKSRIYTTTIWVLVLALFAVAGYGIYAAYQFIAHDSEGTQGAVAEHDMFDDELFETGLFEQLEMHGQYPVKPTSVGKQNPFEP